MEMEKIYHGIRFCDKKEFSKDDPSYRKDLDIFIFGFG